MLGLNKGIYRIYKYLIKENITSTGRYNDKNNIYYRKWQHIGT